MVRSKKASRVGKFISSNHLSTVKKARPSETLPRLMTIPRLLDLAVNKKGVQVTVVLHALIYPLLKRREMSHLKTNSVLFAKSHMPHCHRQKTQRLLRFMSKPIFA